MDVRIRRGVSRDHVNGIDDSRLAGITKNGKPNTWIASKTLMRVAITLRGDRYTG
jgi:hypothetical protein